MHNKKVYILGKMTKIKLLKIFSHLMLTFSVVLLKYNDIRRLISYKGVKNYVKVRSESYCCLFSRN